MSPRTKTRLKSASRICLVYMKGKVAKHNKTKTKESKMKTANILVRPEGTLALELTGDTALDYQAESGTDNPIIETYHTNLQSLIAELEDQTNMRVELESAPAPRTPPQPIKLSPFMTAMAQQFED